MDSTLLAAFIGAVATIAASALTFVSARKVKTQPMVVKVLPDRIAVFKLASRLIDEAHETVIDTTWGNAEENFLPAETEALNSYLRTKEVVNKKSRVIYREIYTETTEEDGRSNRIKDERIRVERPEKYTAKLLDGISPDFPMIDFLIVDSQKIILSCLSRDAAKPDNHYLYIESLEVAAFLTNYFQICWDQAKHLVKPGHPQ